MKLNDYQYEASGTAKELTVQHMAFGLLEEAGEVAGIMKRVFRKDPEYYISPTSESLHAYYAPVSPEARNKIISELGDVLWYTAMLADVLDISLEHVAHRNLSKLKDRKSAGTIKGTGTTDD